MPRWPTTLILLLAPFVCVRAIIAPIEGTRRAGMESLGAARPGTARRRDDGAPGIVDLQNSGDLQYYMNVTLGGKPFRVLVDSGSSDLWVAGDVPGSESTSHTAVIKYQDGTVDGEVRVATLDMQGYSIPKQAYIAEIVSERHAEGMGILGLGPSRLSSVLAQLGGPAGAPPLDRLFQQTDSLQSYVSILLGRSNDPDSPIPGQLTIGEVLPEYDAVTASPQLPVERIDWNQHWMVALDKGGIIGPDGEPIRASVDKRLKVIFDSGYTLPQVPKSVADAIYSRVPGAKYVSIRATATPVWTLPCGTELNITFKFAGVSYPVHPLDTVMDDLQGPLDQYGKPTCVGAFQPMSVEEPYDIILGMAFLRNAYILMSFGDFVNGVDSKAGAPYVQLHALTAPGEAHAAFVRERLAGFDTTGTQTLLPPLASEQEEHTPVGYAAAHRVRQFLPWLVAGCVLGALLLAAGGVWLYFFCWRAGRRYRRLHDPAPCGLSGEDGRPRWRRARREKGPHPTGTRTARSPSTSSEPAAWAVRFVVFDEKADATDAVGRCARTRPPQNPYERNADALARKSPAPDLVPTRRPYAMDCISPKTRRIGAPSLDDRTDTQRLLPARPGTARAYATTMRSAPLVSDRRPPPSPYAVDTPGTVPPKLAPASSAGVFPDPYTMGGLRLAELFDVSRSRAAATYTLPRLRSPTSGWLGPARTSTIS
ncbi:aspartic peptidase domain-containing protein [Trametes elegans]|nr:aspartic peptidase domain-containing protein [Trametes elegans]